ncbi:MAG: N-ethylammeline chlorohydrolase [Candidatus Muiribacterium halophilum]|uniref:N-ethylammeline chlorohydrolase n=1 Tax=Muiribacterium halophilum TaxID=2053465 RepID=A0A2N5ZB20_MUIH1|nr:MAG: N-ethylammeline chlorohydrolase [Candidatus Muirbacterium halophilum]
MLILKNGTLLTYNSKGDFIKKNCDIKIVDDKITDICEPNTIITENSDCIDCTDKYITPGFIQTHIHLCQVLFRGSADDMELLDWLKKRIWPLESLHTKSSIDISSRLGLAEVIAGGTTTIVDMGTTRHTEIIAENIIKSGIRAFFGKTMMDEESIPEYIKEDTDTSLSEVEDLINKYHNSASGRVKYAVSPRFAVSCTDTLMREAAKIADKHGLLYHTHASENKKEVEIVKNRSGYRNIEYFEKNEIASDRLILAHCIWVDDSERDIMKEYDIKVMHCPGANLKLASGISPIPDYLDRGITVSLGGDGAPCNNNLSIFNEMRLAALIQKPIHGPLSMNAYTVFNMATVGGAKTVGLEDSIGTVEVGKKADINIIDLDMFHSTPYSDPVSAIVYAANPMNIDSVIIDGKKIYSRKTGILTFETSDLKKTPRKKLNEMIEKIKDL